MRKEGLFFCHRMFQSENRKRISYRQTLHPSIDSSLKLIRLKSGGACYTCLSAPNACLNQNMGIVMSHIARFLRSGGKLFFPQSSALSENSIDGGSEMCDRDSETDEIFRRGVTINYMSLGPISTSAFRRLMQETKAKQNRPLPRRLSGNTGELFVPPRKIPQAQIRGIVLYGLKRFAIATDLMKKSKYREALREYDKISSLSYEVLAQTAFNKSHCWEMLQCYNNALDEVLKSLLIDEKNPAAHFKAGRLLHRKMRFFEADYCLRQALHLSSPGDMLSELQIRRAVKNNMFKAVIRSGFDRDVAQMASCLFNSLDEVSTQLTSGETFRQKYMWSKSNIRDPVFISESLDEWRTEISR